MAIIGSEDLVYKYKWSHDKKDNPHIVGFPDRTLLDRDEGYEVLPFINKFAAKHKLNLKSSALKIEKMIKQDLPGNIRSHSNVAQWLEENW